VFSFFPRKDLGVYGDGGVIAINDDALSEHMQMVRVHSNRVKHHDEIIGYNSWLDEIQQQSLELS